MPLKVRWTISSIKQLNSIQSYLQLHFGSNTSKAFVVKVFAIIDNLCEFPELGTMQIKEKGIRGFLITMHNYSTGIPLKN